MNLAQKLYQAMEATDNIDEFEQVLDHYRENGLLAHAIPEDKAVVFFMSDGSAMVQTDDQIILLEAKEVAEHVAKCFGSPIKH